MKKWAFLLISINLVFCSVAGLKPDNHDLGQLFKNPSESAKPWVYWYWLNSCISKEGISKDLEAMNEIGIGEALIGTVRYRAIGLGNVPVLSEEWWDCTAYALRKADSLGMKVGMFNCPGWSEAGGPWVTPERAMRYLATSEYTVKGPKHITFKFPDQDRQNFEQNLMSDAYVYDKSKVKFQQVAVLAFPKPASDDASVNQNISSVISYPSIGNIRDLFDGNSNTKVNFAGDTLTILLELNKAQIVRNIQLLPVDISMDATCKLQYMEENGNWKSIMNRKIERQNVNLLTGCLPFSPIANGFDAVNSKKFRIVIVNRSKTVAPQAFGCLSEIELSGAPRLSFYPEKQLNKVSPFDTDIPKGIENKELVIDKHQIVNITANVDKDGVLVWNVPEGEWIIQRTGLMPTGTHNHPTADEGRGFEVDKMNKEYIQAHFDSYIGELLRRIPPKNREALKHIVVDSYEQGPENWTEGFEDEFVKTYGYSPLKWMPVLRGRIVESTAQSERFLWDMRRLIADMVATNFSGTLQQRCKDNGLRLWQENYGSWGFPSEFLLYGKATDDISGEFWYNRSSPAGSKVAECRSASSAANIYGKQIVSAESFTSTDQHKNMPRDMKRKGDLAFAQGINHIVMHVYIHQPDERKPGMNAWYGTDFNRNSTWFAQSKSYMDYFKRATTLLQQGKRVTDVAYYIGEDVPIVGGVQNVKIPSGFDFDYVNADVILNNSTVENGMLVLQSGAKYRALVLPDAKSMRPELLARIEQLVMDGVTVLGNKPLYSPSLRNYPDCDTMVDRLASKMWEGLDGKTKVYKNYGKGRIFCGVDLDDVFSRMNLVPDVSMPDDYVFTHRRTEQADIFFVSNQLERARKDTLGFRITDKYPELFDAVTGDIRPLPEYKVKGEMMNIPLEFEPSGSWFIVFRNQKKLSIKGKNFYPMSPIQEVNGTWNVSFKPKLGMPEQTEFATLSDWTTSSNPSIKYYSGTATYKNKFQFSGNVSQTYYINLGRVETLAKVRLNGIDLGTLWCYPYSVNLSNALKKGENVLEVDVTNPWWNRLIGDKQANAKQYTWTAYSNWNAKDPLLPAGLLGPVTIDQLDN